MPLSVHQTRLACLRRALQARGLAGFVVPLSDEHLSEYVGAYAQRLAWLTGFGGSAGCAVVLAEKAAIFVDGRYTLQVREEVDAALYEYCAWPARQPGQWLAEQAGPGGAIGYDPWLHPPAWVKATSEKLAARTIALVPVADNPVDAVWSDRPLPSLAPAFLQEAALAGCSSAQKRAAIAAWLEARDCAAVVISALDSVAWVLNIRGSDVARTPVALSWLIVRADGSAQWFIAPQKVPADLAGALGSAVQIAPRESFAMALGGFAGIRVAVDPQRTVAAVFALLEQGGAQIVEAMDPAVLPKAIKNPAEQAGHRAAQARDGMAMARFLHWLDEEGPRGQVSELSAAARLEEFRRATGALHDLSFDTISGAGPNGAIVHYRVSEASNRGLAPGSVYLVDSGGQYRDGTTDITRTVWIGAGQGDAGPPAIVRDRFTRVLKGHIRLARQVFPAGTRGSQLDPLARQYLWEAGLDYAHGTGHGVGSFLSVHEGPHRIARAPGADAEAEQELLPGMIISNEPGYYEPGAYGIRIENLVLVEPRDLPEREGRWLGFETLTLAPIDRRLLAPELLVADEIAWWNAYHARVWLEIGPLLEGAAQAWLAAACAPLPPPASPPATPLSGA